MRSFVFVLLYVASKASSNAGRGVILVYRNFGCRMCCHACAAITAVTVCSSFMTVSPSDRMHLFYPVRKPVRQVFIDPNDPSMDGRVVCELDGQDDDEGDEDMDEQDDDDQAGPGDVEDEEEVIDVSKGGHSMSVKCPSVRAREQFARY